VLPRHINPAAAENVAAVVTQNYKDVKKAADRFAKAGGVNVEVWTYAPRVRWWRAGGEQSAIICSTSSSSITVRFNETQHFSLVTRDLMDRVANDAGAWA
jgi:hypothetical protein